VETAWLVAAPALVGGEIACVAGRATLDEAARDVGAVAGAALWVQATSRGRHEAATT
jgi:hypothetical protein